MCKRKVKCHSFFAVGVEYENTKLSRNTLLLVYQLHIKDRYEEWCLYRSLGYSAKSIFVLALKEFILCLLIGFVFALLCIGIIFIFGGAIMDNKGIPYRLCLPDAILQLSGILVFLSALLQIPVLKVLRTIKTVDAIEDDL